MANPTPTEVTAKPVVEVVKNCAGCNKPIKRHKRYYRNGKYYCTQKCYKTTSKAASADAAKEEKAPEKKEEKKEA